MNTNTKMLIHFAVALLLVTAMVMPEAAFAQSAGGGDEEFGGLYGVIYGWITGTLGKIIALTCLLVGLAMGVVRQSIMAAVVGIAMAITLFYAPRVIDNIFEGDESGTAMVVTAPVNHIA